jgi:hypothetical protein
MGLGVLFTTIRKIHCSQLYKVAKKKTAVRDTRYVKGIRMDGYAARYRNRYTSKLPTYTTFSSCETSPKSCRVARLSKKLRVKQPWIEKG